jgi:hypothetical protein
MCHALVIPSMFFTTMAMNAHSQWKIPETIWNPTPLGIAFLHLKNETLGLNTMVKSRSGRVFPKTSLLFI